MNTRDFSRVATSDMRSSDGPDSKLPMHREYWLDRPRNIATLYYGVWVLGLFLVLADFFTDRHAEIGFDAVVGFYAMYGFIACVLLVFTAKGLRRLLKRPENYYEH